MVINACLENTSLAFLLNSKNSSGHVFMQQLTRHFCVFWSHSIWCSTISSAQWMQSWEGSLSTNNLVSSVLFKLRGWLMLLKRSTVVELKSSLKGFGFRLSDVMVEAAPESTTETNRWFFWSTARPNCWPWTQICIIIITVDLSVEKIHMHIKNAYSFSPQYYARTNDSSVGHCECDGNVHAWMVGESPMWNYVSLSMCLAPFLWFVFHQTRYLCRRRACWSIVTHRSATEGGRTLAKGKQEWEHLSSRVTWYRKCRIDGFARVWSETHGVTRPQITT